MSFIAAHYVCVYKCFDAVGSRKDIQPINTGFTNSKHLLLGDLASCSSRSRSGSGGSITSTTTVLWPFFQEHPGEPVPEENFWTLWCKGKLTQADTPAIWLGVTPSGLSSAHLHHPPCFLQAGCPSCHTTNNVKALKATQSTDGNGGSNSNLISLAFYMHKCN